MIVSYTTLSSIDRYLPNRHLLIRITLNNQVRGSIAISLTHIGLVSYPICRTIFYNFIYIMH